MKFKDKKVLVGVTGGIAAYKTCTLINYLIKEGAEVRVMMTENAQNFVTPLTFQALTNHKVYVDMWEEHEESSIEHISISRWPDLVIVSPITANTIAKISAGFADNFLTTTLLATQDSTKIILVPAMNVYMWSNPLVQRNVDVLRNLKKFVFIEPRSGILACRDEGKGKIADIEDILEVLENVIKKDD